MGTDYLTIWEIAITIFCTFIYIYIYGFYCYYYYLLLLLLLLWWCVCVFYFSRPHLRWSAQTGGSEFQHYAVYGKLFRAYSFVIFPLLTYLSDDGGERERERGCTARLVVLYMGPILNPNEKTREQHTGLVFQSLIFLVKFLAWAWVLRLN